jgi:hypothetical protein
MKTDCGRFAVRWRQRRGISTAAGKNEMKGTGILVFVALATATVLLSCWYLVGPSTSSAPGGVSVRASGRSASESLPPEPPTVVESEPRAPRVEYPMYSVRRSGETPAGVGTTILVVDSTTEEPIERFALRIMPGSAESAPAPEALSEVPIREFPEGALVVPVALEGFHFSIHAPGYLPLIGEVTPISSADRRVFIRLDHETVVRGRALFEGKPVSDAIVKVEVSHGEPSDIELRHYDWTDPVTRNSRTDEEGNFVVNELPGGYAAISLRTPAGFTFDLVVEELAAGVELDLGDLELTRGEELVERFSISLGGEVFELSELELAKLQELGELEEIIATGAIQFGSAVSKKKPSGGLPSLLRARARLEKTRRNKAQVRVQALDGEQPLAGAAVFIRYVGESFVREVGTTDSAGELLFRVASGKPVHIILRTGGQLPLGQTETPITVARGQEMHVPIILRCGALALEIPEAFTPGSEFALLLQFDSEALPDPGYVIVTLRGDPADFASEGIDWAGNRCEFPSLAAGHYRIRADVLKKTRDAPGARLLPTELCFEGVAEVVAGEKVTCPLSIH